MCSHFLELCGAVGSRGKRGWILWLEPVAGERDALQKFKCGCNTEVKGECAPDYSQAGLVRWHQGLQHWAQSAGRLSEFDTSVLKVVSYCCPPEKLKQGAPILSAARTASQRSGWVQQCLCSREVQTAGTPLDSDLQCAVRPEKLTTDLGFSDIEAACVNLCLRFFCEKRCFFRKHLNTWAFRSVQGSDSMGFDL